MSATANRYLLESHKTEEFDGLATDPENTRYNTPREQAQVITVIRGTWDGVVWLTEKVKRLIGLH